LHPIKSNVLIESYEKSKLRALLDSNQPLEKDKHLHKSRSEQDLKELIHESKQSEDVKPDDSFRILDSERQQ
jgi:hypothetical protein